MSQFIPVFRLLNDANVRYVVVGGIAAVLHGHVRATADIDLVIDLEPTEATKAIRALVDGGFKPLAPVDPLLFANPIEREGWINNKGMKVFSLHSSTPGPSVDLFVRHPIPFEDLWSRAVSMDLGGVEVKICSIDDLIALKRSAGRPQDLADIEQLARIQEIKARTDE
jgi:predicted nucleotidyltransferase